MKKSSKKQSKKSPPASQADLELFAGELTHRMDGLEEKVDGLEEKIEKSATELRQEMQDMEKRIVFEFRAAVENIHDEMAGANKDEISSLKDTDRELDMRVTALEEKSLS